MHLTDTVTVFEAIWIAISALTLPYGLRLTYDAHMDVRARLQAGINGSRGDLAHLLVITSALTSFAFFVFLVCGLIAATIPSSPYRPLTYVIVTGLILAESALSVALIYKQHVRRRVLQRDMAMEEARLAGEIVANRTALEENTQAVTENTQARARRDPGSRTRKDDHEP
jgi:membrane protein implicated in regulation of membrane protease activity